MRCSYVLLMSIGSMFWSACSLGPAAIRVNSTQYNKAIQQTGDEQLLLNLVRLRYRETPLFLELTALSTQYEFGASAGAGGRINENVGGSNVPNFLNLDAAIQFKDKPTISFTPLHGQDFVQRLMSPLDLSTIISLYYSGWNVDRILRLSVQRVNGLENAMGAAGPTPARAPEYEAFLNWTRDLHELQAAGALDLGEVSERSAVALPVAADSVGVADVLRAAENGLRFDPDESGRLMTLTRPAAVPYVRLAARGSLDEPLRPILDRVYRAAFGRQAAAGEAATTAIRMRRGVAIGLNEEPDDEGGELSLSIVTRSLIGAMFFLSQSVEAPAEHEEKGWVTVTRAAGGDRFDWTRVTEGLFRVHSSSEKPGEAAIAVPYRGHWFFIAEDDLDSKSTFALLRQILSLKSGNQESTAPVLTLAVGN